MRNIWEPAGAIFGSQHPQTPPSSASRKKRREHQVASKLTPEQKLGLLVMKEFPNLFHMTFFSKEGFRLWAAVRPENLTISGADLTMKHGAVMDGLWTVIGIVDAGIGVQPKPMPLSDALDGVVTAMATLREHIGRPANHFGITPIAIYAPIRGIAETEAEVSTERTCENTVQPSDGKA